MKAKLPQRRRKSFSERSLSRRQKSTRRVREALFLELLEKRLLLTGVSLETTSSAYNVTFDTDQAIMLDEFVNSSGKRQLQYRLGDSAPETDFDEGGDEDPIILSGLQHDLVFKSVQKNTSLAFGNLNTSGNSLTANSQGEIIVDAFSILSTRVLDPGLSQDDANGSSIADSGNVDFTSSQSIVIGGDLYAQVDENSNFMAGNVTLSVSHDDNVVTSGADTLSVQLTDASIHAHTITISAERQDRAFRRQVISTGDQNVDVSLLDSQLIGDTIHVTSTAKEVTGYASGKYQLAGTQLTGAALKGIKSLVPSKVPLPDVAYFNRHANANLTVSGTTIDATDSITLESTASADTELIAVQTRPIYGGPGGYEVAAGYGKATSNAITDLLASSTNPTLLTAGGDITISSTGTSKSKVNVRTMAPYQDKFYKGPSVTLDASPATMKMAAIALAFTELTSRTTVGEGATVDAEGRVAINATGTPQTIPNASTAAYGDGLVGVTIALGFDDTKIETTIDGNVSSENYGVTASGNAGGTGTQDLDRASITQTTLPYDPTLNWSRGDIVTYNVAGFDSTEPISPLVHDQNYVIVEVLDNAIKLANILEMDLELPVVDNNTTQSLNVLSTLPFKLSQNVDFDSNEFSIPGNGFETGEPIQYLAISDSDSDATTYQQIGGLYDQEKYFVIAKSGDVFQLALSYEDALNGEAIDITDPQDSATDPIGQDQAFAYISSTKTFNPQLDLDPNNNTFAIDTSGIETGSRLIYETDLAFTSAETLSTNHTFAPEQSWIEFDPQQIVQLDQTVLDLTNNLLIFPNHGLSNGDPLVFSKTSGPDLSRVQTVNDANQPQSLTEATNSTLFVIFVDDDRIQLAWTAEDAQAKTAITFEPPQGSGEYVLQPTGASSSDGSRFAFDPTTQVEIPSVDENKNVLFFTEPHGYVTGQRLSYEAGVDEVGQVNTPIGGLESASDASGQASDYYAIVLNDNELQLASSRDQAVAGVPIDLTSTGSGNSRSPNRWMGHDVDLTQNTIVSAAHGLETGQAVTYRTEGGTAVDGLADNTTYYVIRLDANTIRLADTIDAASQSAIDPSSGGYIELGSNGTGEFQSLLSSSIVRTFDASRTTPLVNLEDNTLELPYSFVTGQMVNYQSSGGEPIGGLENSQDYYIIQLANEKIQLATSYEQATAEPPVAIPLTSRGTFGSGSHALRISAEVDLLADELPVIAFDPTELEAVIGASDATHANVINLTKHGFETGQEVTYLAGDGTAIPGLSNGGKYYVIAITDNSLQLAASDVDANSGNELPIDTGATGSNHGFEIVRSYNVSDAPIQGLQSGNAYYAVVDGPNSLRLTEAYWDSQLAEVIEYDTTNYTSNLQASLSAPTTAAIEISSSTTSMKNQSLAGASLGGKPNFSDLLSKPEVTQNSRVWKTAFSGNKNTSRFLKQDNTGLSPVRNGSSWAFASSVGVTIADHTVVTSVGGTVETIGDISISSNLQQNSKTFAKASASAGGGKKFSFAIGIAFGDFNNTVVAEIGEGAIVDASGVIDIDATLSYPRLKYPTVKDGVATSGNESRKNPFNDITVLSKWIGPTSGIDSYLNVWANSVIFKPDSRSLKEDGSVDDAYNKRASTAITGSIGTVFYENDTQAIIRDGAQINQQSDFQADTQQVELDASLSMEVISLAGMFKVNFLRGLLSWNMGTAFSLFGNKAKGLGMGVSDVFVDSENTTLALIESGAAVHSGSAGLKVNTSEQLKKNVFAESGSESDGVGIGVSGAESLQTSTNIAQIDVGATIQTMGGPLAVDATADTRQIVTSGSLVASDALGIGLSGSIVDLDRKSGAFIGAAPAGWGDRYEVYGASDGSSSNDSVLNGRIDAARIDVNSSTSGEVYNASIVGVTPTFRLSKNPAADVTDEGEAGKQASFQLNDKRVVQDVENKFHLNVAGDAAVNYILDETQSQIDLAGFAAITASSTTDPQSADITVTSDNATRFEAFSGAGAITSGKRAGSGAAVAGSAAINLIKDQTTTAKIVDSSGAATKTVKADGDISVGANSGEAFDDGRDADATIWAISGSLAYAASGGFTNSGALSASWNELIGSTDATVAGVNLHAENGSVTINAVNQHKITGDGGSFAIAREKRAERGSNAESMAFGGSYGYNNLDYDITATLSNDVHVVGNSLDVNAEDEAEITSLALAGAAEEGASEVALSISVAGANNEIQRDVSAVVGRSTEDGLSDADRGTIDVTGDIRVHATDVATIHALSGGVTFSLDTKVAGVFQGSAGASWSSNQLSDESQVNALVDGMNITTPGAMSVQATEDSDIQALSLQLGVLGSFGEGPTVNAAGAIGLNTIGGMVSADLRTSDITAGSVDLAAESSGVILAKTVDASLQVTTGIANVGVGINVTENQITTDVTALVDNSDLTLTGDFRLQSSAAASIDSLAVNASVEVTITIEEISISANWLGIWSNNDVRQMVHTDITNSVIHDAASILLAAEDQTSLNAEGVGSQTIFDVGTSLDIGVGALTQFASNATSNDVAARVEASELTTSGDLQVATTKSTNLTSDLYTVALGFTGSGGVAINASAATTVLENSIAADSGNNAVSATQALISDSQISAGAVHVTADFVPLVYSKIWDIDIQATFGGEAAGAGVFGEAKVTTDIKDQTFANISNASTVHTALGGVEVAARLTLPDASLMPDNAPASSVYVDSHSVGVTASFSPSFISAAATVLRSNLETNVDSSIVASVVDSDVASSQGLTVLADDASVVFGTIRDTAIAASVVAIAATAPKASQTISNTVQATIESTSDSPMSILTSGAPDLSPIEETSATCPVVIVQTDDADDSGNLFVSASSRAHLNTESVIWSGSVGLGSASSTSNSDSTLSGTVDARIDGGTGSSEMQVNAQMASVTVNAWFDGTNDMVVHSGAVGANLLSVDTARPEITTSPDVEAVIEGKVDVIADDLLYVVANAEGRARGETQQTTVSLGFAGGGLELKTWATPIVTARVGDDVAEEDDQPTGWKSANHTKASGRQGVNLSSCSMVDASSEATMNGGALLVTVLSPSSSAEVSPEVGVVVGAETEVRSANGVIEIQATGGQDKSPRPTDFNADTGVDTVANTIEFDDDHRLQTGDLVSYENSSGRPDIGGLDAGREYHVIRYDAKKVQLGEELNSDASTVITSQDRLNFGRNAPFQGPFPLDQWDPSSWDVITYHQRGDRPIAGLTDKASYLVNRVDDDEIMLLSPDDPNPAPKPIDGASVIENTTASEGSTGVDGSFIQILNHGFNNGDSVTYRPADYVTFSASAVNVDVSDANPPVTDDPNAVDLTSEGSSSLSHTIYLGDVVSQLENNQLVQYTIASQSEGAESQWFWTEGPSSSTSQSGDAPSAGEDPSADQSSSDLHELAGTQFWNGGVDGSSVRNAYVNWAADQPDTTTVDKHFTSIDSDGFWSNRDGDNPLNYYVIERPQFILHNVSKSVGDAKAYAESVGGWLPSISSDDELQRAVTAAAGNTVWLGGSDDAKEDVWVWDSKPANSAHLAESDYGTQFWQGGKNGYSTTEYTIPWNKGEPNDGGGATAVRNKETALEMYGSGLWNDTKDEHKNKNLVLVEMPRYDVIYTSSPLTFDQARDHAKTKDGWLATIGSAEDNSKIAELLGDNTDAWIGASDSLVIKGLKNGGRYIVEKVTDDSSHRDSVRLYTASESGVKGNLIEIDSIGVPASVNHQLLPVSEMAIVGLEAGYTYYVADASADEFRLKAAPNDDSTLILSGNDPMGQGEIGRNGFIGYMGIDLGINRDSNGNIVVDANGDDVLDDVGEGSQQLMFALSSQTSGIQSLPYIKLGPRAASDGTGTASSHVHSVGGSLVAQSVRPKATSTADPIVTINLAAGSHLHAAEDIDITAISSGNAVTKGEGYGGALLASGAGTTVASTVSHAAKVNLFGSLTSNADLTIEAKVSDDVEAHADTKSYGALDANANSEATINNAFDAVITFDQNARLAAGKSIEVNAITS
ncbi:hypothetical protein N9D23_07495, partial [Rubripirellula sp.]|nr:hypothetical protein [Rubripirellula sp.]